MMCSALLPAQKITAAEHGKLIRGRYISLVSENDNYVPPRDDRHYTSGQKLAYGFSRGMQPGWLNWLGRFSMLDANNHEYDIAIGQSIYTPRVFTIPQLIINDRPYAGWLYGEVSVTNRENNTEDQFTASLGVVGPAALGEEAQKFIHSISGDPEPVGWDNQLDNEPAFLLHYRHSWFQKVYQSDRVTMDYVPRLGVSLGNVASELGLGSSLRAGSFLPIRDTPQRIQPGLNASSPRFEARRGRTDWMLLGGFHGRAVLRNIFLDGNTFQDSHDVHRRVLTWDASLGLMLTFGQFSHPLALSFTHVWRGKEFDAQRETDKFGSIQLSVQF